MSLISATAFAMNAQRHALRYAGQTDTHYCAACEARWSGDMAEMNAAAKAVCPKAPIGPERT